MAKADNDIPLTEPRCILGRASAWKGFENTSTAHIYYVCQVTESELGWWRSGSAYDSNDTYLDRAVRGSTPCRLNLFPIRRSLDFAA
jgi:hypothetical protein